MSFDNKGFTPVHVNAGALAPRIFAYCNMKDLLSEIMKPGYFNEKKLIMRPNSFVKVVCKDAIAEMVVECNTGDMAMKEEITMASVLPAELAEPKLSPQQRAAITRKKNKDDLAKTG